MKKKRDQKLNRKINLLYYCGDFLQPPPAPPSVYFPQPHPTPLPPPCNRALTMVFDLTNMQVLQKTLLVDHMARGSWSGIHKLTALR